MVLHIFEANGGCNL